MSDSIEQVLRNRITAAFELGYKHYDGAGNLITDVEQVLTRLMNFEPVASIPPPQDQIGQAKQFELKKVDEHDFIARMEQVRLTESGAFIIPRHSR